MPHQPLTSTCAVIVAGTWLIAALVAAPQQPTFRSGVEVIVIDVNVVDKSHVPVDDLKAGDFVVSVDDKPRKVVSAQFLRYDVRTPITRGRAEIPAAGASAPTDVPSVPASARNVLIVIDEDSMEPGDGLLLQREVATFIDGLAPDDRIGVVTIPRPKSEVTMTKIRAQVKAELAKVITGSERYRSQQFSIGLWEAFDAEGDPFLIQKIQLRECRLQVGDPDCRRAVAAEIRYLRTQERLRGERSLNALRDLGRALEKVDGPKTMLLVSGGSPPPDSKSNTSYTLVANAFAAGQISLYTLYVEQPEFGQVKYRASPTAAQDHVIEREGIENATSASGGTFMEAIGTWGQYFDRIVTELSGSYLLGIEVEPADRNGRPHEVSVKVNRRDVDVRARRQYVITSRKATASNPSPPAPVRAPSPPVESKRPDARAVEAARELEALLSRVIDYVAAYRRQYSGVVADEDYRQRTPTAEVRLRSDFLLVKASEDEGWVSFRDVYEVDGAAVRDREDRLKKLFLDPTVDAASQLRKIKEESARYNVVGDVVTNVNVPLFPLLFLDRANVPRFQFKLGGRRESQGLRAIQYEERQRPTIVRDMRTTGWFLVEAASGAVVESGTTYTDALNQSAEIVVKYTQEPKLGLWVPATMDELYRGTTGNMVLTGTAVYSKFRSFKVTTDEKVTIKK